MSKLHAYKLRVYLKEIEETELMTNQQWIDMWASHVNCNAPFIPRIIWLEYLRNCALTESKQLVA